MKSRTYSLARNGLLALSMSVVMQTGCGNEDPAADTTAGACAQALAENDFARALHIGGKLARQSSDARFCKALAHLGQLAEAVDAAVGTPVGTGTPQSAFQPTAKWKPLLADFVDPVQQAIRGFDAEAYALAGMKDSTFRLERFPLPLDLQALLALVYGNHAAVEGDASIDLGGTWSTAEIQLLAAVLNGVQGLLDYALAHELDGDLFAPRIIYSLDPKTSEAIATYLARNPSMFQKASDADDAARLTGNVTHKGLLSTTLAVLSHLVGRDLSLAGVAPANEGLLARIEASAARPAEDSVIAWTVDQDGYPVKASIRTLALLNEQARITIGGRRWILPTVFDLDLGAAGWNALTAFGTALRDNIERSNPARVAVKPLLDGLRLSGRPTIGSISRLLEKEAPDMIYLNPGAFLSEPPLLKELLPQYFAYTTEASAPKRYDLAVEYETWWAHAPMTVSRLILTQTLEPGTDAGHFWYGRPASYAVTAIEASETFPADERSHPTDGLMPSPSSPRLIYLALTSPSFGKLLEMSLDGEAPTPPDVFDVNRGLNTLIGYYCLNMWKHWGAFDGANYDDDYPDCPNDK